jgi:xanthosine utilization system XapX-like protein
MIDKTFLYTSLFSALFTTLSLKFLQMFSFVKWSPIGWADKWPQVDSYHYSIKWALLFMGLFIIFAILYILSSFLVAIPPSLSAIIIGIIGVIIVEWIISEPKSLQSLFNTISYPFLATIAITLRFITGTATFMRKV